MQDGDLHTDEYKPKNKIIEKKENKTMRITKTQLLNRVAIARCSALHHGEQWKRLGACKADTLDVTDFLTGVHYHAHGDGITLAQDKHKHAYVLLRSYASTVALYSGKTGTVYEFERYSATTTKHVYRFAREMSAARITRLYIPSSSAIPVEVALNLDEACPLVLTRSEQRELDELDYEGIIETIELRKKEE